MKQRITLIISLFFFIFITGCNPFNVGYCGDGLCTEGLAYHETCENCPQDCYEDEEKYGCDMENENTNEWGFYELEEECASEWNCTEWTICSLNGLKNRSCVDINGCSNNIHQEQTCDPLEAYPECPEVNDLDMIFVNSERYKLEINMTKTYSGWNFRDSLFDTGSVNCFKGNNEGQNVNWWYCGVQAGNPFNTLSMKLEVISSEGIILTQESETLTLVYDENLEYVETLCGY